eukprot:531280_1
MNFLKKHLKLNKNATVIDDTVITQPYAYSKRLLELVCYGFLRNIEQSLSKRQLIPDGIMKICYKYCLFVGFIFTNPGKIKKRIKTIHNVNGEIRQIIQNGGGIESICYANKGFKKNKIENIYEWTIECEHMSLNDMIGITCTLDNINNIEYAFNLSNISHFWWAHDGIWQNMNTTTSKSYDEWNNGDIITIILDLENSFVTFHKNGKMVFQPIALKNTKEDCVWYPFIGLGDSLSCYVYKR